MNDKSQNELPSLWTVRVAAVKLATTPHAIYKLVEKRRIPFVRIGKRIRFDPTVISRWIEENSIPADWGKRP
jgi:excisionase family DNA binding protein